MKNLLNKLAIPAILVAAVMVAGIFAFSPIVQVSTVHTTILDSSEVSCDEVTATTSIVDTGGNDAAITETFDITNSAGAEPFIIENIIINTDGVDDAGDDLSVQFNIHDFNSADIVGGNNVDVIRHLFNNFIFAPIFSDGDTITMSVLEDIDDTAEAGTNFDYTITVCGYANGGNLEIVET